MDDYIGSLLEFQQMSDFLMALVQNKSIFDASTEVRTMSQSSPNIQMRV